MTDIRHPLNCLPSRNISPMIKAVLKFIVSYLAFVALFVVEKPLFMAVYHRLYTDSSFADILAVIWHGLPVDLAVAAYCTVVPGIIIAVMLASGSRVPRIAERIYYMIISVVLAAAAVLNLVLYGYWDFPLDATPVFYFFSSPAAAFASVTGLQIAGGFLGLAAVSGVLYFFFRFSAMGIHVQPLSDSRKRSAGVLAMTVLTAALFIPIRGGITVSTMNPSRAYFSTDYKLNHAAMNPAFSFLYSVTHQNNFSAQFRFMEPDRADNLFRAMTHTASAQDTLLTTQRPDIWIVIAESFSSHLMPSLGGEDVASRLDSIARSGLLFTNFYASSFRTDRALPAILSAFPGQPNTSVMKFVSKTENLPSMPLEFRKAGYDTEYYYGGDINFTNMLAFLKNSGFEKIVRDSDFPLSQRASKWGAPDSYLFDKVIADISGDTTSTPKFRVVQTSSSHEPFKVPYRSRFANERLNAFAYADSCIGAFVDTLAASPRWNNTLVVIVPDHFGVYPENLEDNRLRHSIPLIMTGGALRMRGTNATVGVQTDIAATLMDACGLDHSRFVYSKNLLDSLAPHYAFYTTPSAMGFVTATDTVDYSLDSDKPLVLDGPDAQSSLENAKAYLQKLYDNLSEL